MLSSFMVNMMSIDSKYFQFFDMVLGHYKYLSPFGLMWKKIKIKKLRLDLVIT